MPQQLHGVRTCAFCLDSSGPGSVSCMAATRRDAMTPCLYPVIPSRIHSSALQASHVQPIPGSLPTVHFCIDWLKCRSALQHLAIGNWLMKHVGAGYVGLTTPGNLVKAFRQLQGQAGQRAAGRPRDVHPVSKSLAQPTGDKPAASANESTGTSSSDANLGAANPSAANMNYVEELSPKAPSGALPGNQQSSGSSTTRSRYM